LIVVLMACVLAVGFFQQWQAIGRLPSRYDTGLTLDNAFKQTKTPLLVEFYSDTCGTCQRITPMVHDTARQLDGKLTLVMVDVTNPDNQMFTQLFGVTTIPRVFVFDPRKMKKHAVPETALADASLLKKALLSFL
jgi:thiol-disulfide isomerase/thioredoxin